MKKVFISLMILSMLTACAGAVAEAPRNGGRGNGAGGGSMQTLNEGIAYMNGDGVDQDYEKALQLFMEAYEAGSMKAARYAGMMYEQGLGVEQDYEISETSTIDETLVFYVSNPFKKLVVLK